MLARVEEETLLDFEAFEKDRIRSLKSLLTYLKEIQKKNITKEEFTSIFCNSIRTLELDQETISRKLKISRPTVSRWETGKSTPHQLGRKPVFMLFETIAKEKLRQHN